MPTRDAEQERVVRLHDLFDFLAAEVLRHVPMEGAAISLLDKQSKVLRGLGGAGILAGEKVRSRFTSEDAEQAPGVPKPVTCALQRFGLLGGSQDMPTDLGQLLELPIGQVFALSDVASARAAGHVYVMDDIYLEEGPKLREFFALPLERTRRPFGEVLGLLLLNNCRFPDRFAVWAADPANASAVNLVRTHIASLVTELVDNPEGLVSLLRSSLTALPPPLDPSQRREVSPLLLRRLGLMMSLFSLLSLFFASIGAAMITASRLDPTFLGWGSQVSLGLGIGSLAIAIETVGAMAWLRRHALHGNHLWSGRG